MFPDLAQRGWLVTDVTDTTAQALRIRCAHAGAPDGGEIVVRTWDARQIKELVSSPEVEEQHRADKIKVTWLADGVEVDGTEATFAAADTAQFRFPRAIELLPLPEPYRLSAEEAKDPQFIRALTVKEQSALIRTGPVLRSGDRAYNALQLRAVVKDVSLCDPYQRLAQWSGRPPQEIGRLTFVDTPGLAVNGSVKDEVLRHILERKSIHVALQLWKEDDLDIIVHLVLCGRQSDFAGLWKAIERDCGPAEMEDLGERLILAVNGMNLYFTNRDIKAKYEDPRRAAAEGDHFATTIEDNILQKMSPRGRVRPARICFLDSQSIVETLTGGSYAQAYAKFRPIMEQWTRPGAVGHQTLAELGLLESFQRNIAALADPEDRGQGFLLRQILEIAESKGPALLLRKHLIRSGLLAAVEELLELLRAYYDAAGTMNRQAVQESLRSCLAFLDADDLESLEEFAARRLDSRIEELMRESAEHPGDVNWVAEGFRGMCAAVHDAIVEESGAPPELAREFTRYYAAQTQLWAEHWGYTAARMTQPDKSFAHTADLLAHCLKLHGREILYQLLIADHTESDGAAFAQTPDDKQQIAELMRMLEEAHRRAAASCAEHGVKT